MEIKATRSGKVQAVVGREVYDLFDKGENSPEQIQTGINTLNQLVEYDKAVVAAKAQAADAQAKLDAMKPGATVYIDNSDF